MAGFDNDNVYFSGIDTRGVKPVVNQMTTDGQLLIGSTASPHIKVGTLTAGTGIAITNGSGSITITSVGEGLTWQNISASQTMAIENGYQCTGGGALALLLPPVSAIGDIIEITLDGSASFTVTQGAGQAIRLAQSVTTGGVGGSLASTAQGDSLRMVCTVANLRWSVLSSMGNITVV